jgi:hypothetical protein
MRGRMARRPPFEQAPNRRRGQLKPKDLIPSYWNEYNIIYYDVLSYKNEFKKIDISFIGNILGFP